MTNPTFQLLSHILPYVQIPYLAVTAFPLNFSSQRSGVKAPYNK